MKKNVILTLSALALAGFYGCSDNNDAPAVDGTLNTQILADFSTHVAQATYNDLQTKAATLNDDIQSFVASPDDTKLTKLRTDWKAARQAWEQSESFLFGPVDTDKIDPRIDSWPINTEDFNKELNGSHELTEEYIDGLGEDIKGFHPIEYIVFGEDGKKTAADFTNKRELDYLSALGLNLKKLTAEAAVAWDPASSSSYTTVFVKAGSGSTEFPTQRSAFEQLVDAMAGICEEVADEKIGSVYQAQDPSLEESPYAQNSLIDFRNNIIGVQNVYLGKYSADGTSLEDLTKKYNLTLDGEIKAALSVAISALGSIDGTFGEAISHGANVKVQNAIDAIHALHEKLNDDAASNNDLMYLVQQHTN